MSENNEPERGPMYGVELPEDFPLSGGWAQACPGRGELERAVAKGFTRLVAAYEMALKHMRDAEDKWVTAMAELGDARNTLSAAVIHDIRTELQVPDGRSVVEVATERMGEIRELRAQLESILHPPVFDMPNEPGWWWATWSDGTACTAYVSRVNGKLQFLSDFKTWQRITLPTPPTTTKEAQP